MLNTVGMIVTAILNIRLGQWAQTSAILPEEQYGFIPAKNHRLHFYPLYTDRETKIVNSTLFVCYVDLKKVFDNVEHTLMWGKLHSIGLSNLQSTYIEKSHSQSEDKLLPGNRCV